LTRKLTFILAAVVASSLQACGGDANGEEPLKATASFVRAYPGLKFDQPIALVRRPGDDSRWYVGEKPGRIRWFDNSPDAKASTLALDISPHVVNPEPFDERGFLGLAFHPRFAQNGKIYVNYVTPRPDRSRISEFTSPDGGDTFDPGSERILLEVTQPASNHNGGHLEFGPDGYLYAGFGDGGAANDYYENGQRMTTVLGKMIRIDTDSRTGKAEYGIPADNPFAGNPVCKSSSRRGSECPEIWTTGMRNPWRYTFDRETGDLWVGDVMQDNYEEINLVVKGANYGWPIRQGRHCFPTGTSGCRTEGLTDPVAELLRDEGGASIIVGYVYRGKRTPQLNGRLIFTDAGSGIIGSVHRAGDGKYVRELLNTKADYTIAFVSFGESADGEMYAVSLRNGTIHHLDLRATRAKSESR
jgi:glucose/arabinose dehydrogenase